MSWSDPCSYCGEHRADCDCGHWGEQKPQSKQQSIEEAAKKYSGIAYDRQDYEEKYFNNQGCDKYDAFIAGAKWQQLNEVCDICDRNENPQYKMCKYHRLEYEQFKQEKL